MKEAAKFAFIRGVRTTFQALSGVFSTLSVATALSDPVTARAIVAIMPFALLGCLASGVGAFAQNFAEAIKDPVRAENASI